MDSITHTLFKAITVDNAHQRANVSSALGLEAQLRDKGLVPFSERPKVHQSFAGAAQTDLHISLTRGDELLALQMEFIAAGFTPPATMYHQGADVILAPGEVQLFVPTDNGEATWMASLRTFDQRNFDASREKRARWSEQVG